MTFLFLKCYDKEVRKKLNSFLKVSYLQLLLGVILVLMTVVGVLLFWNSTKEAEQILLDKLKLREFTLARAGSLAIGEFFESRKIRLLILASLTEIKTIDKEKGPEIVRKMIYEIQDQPVSAIGVIDKQGKLAWSENPQKQKVEAGVDLSDRAYFQWTKTQKEAGGVYISEPIISRAGPSEGSWIVTVVTPLFNNNQFNGAIYLSIPVKDLVDKFVLPLTISSKSSQMIITQEGLVIASTIPETTGTNILEEDKKKEGKIKGLSELLDKLIAGQDVSTIMEVTYQGGKSTKMVYGYAPIKIDGTPWYLLVSVPYDEIVEQMFPFSEIQNEGLFLLFIGLIVIILFDVLMVRIAERQAYRSGYSNCLKESKNYESKKK